MRLREKFKYKLLSLHMWMKPRTAHFHPHSLCLPSASFSSAYLSNDATSVLILRWINDDIFFTLFACRYSAVSPSAVKRPWAVVRVSWCSVINAFLQASSVLANEHCFCFVCVKLHFIDSVLPSLLIPVVWCKKTNPTAPVNVVIMKYCTMALVKSCTLPFRRHSAKLINYYITAVFSLCFRLWSCQPT